MLPGQTPTCRFGMKHGQTSTGQCRRWCRRRGVRGAWEAHVGKQLERGIREQEAPTEASVELVEYAVHSLARQWNLLSPAKGLKLCHAVDRANLQFPCRVHESVEERSILFCKFSRPSVVSVTQQLLEKLTTF